ncbi:hypothetical protein GCM10023152_36390 [Agromyces bauzanensis]|uniref:Uncharacterized protein n=1 Tax=Agromyces bauzanensis TaxID=1308924 RepID=A0A917PKL3_9MICO|nr:hypothetical protein GCM10011372_21630 [Agromyces bauzanensis]
MIRREIDDRISDLFVSGALGDGEGVRVDAAGGEFVVASVPNATVSLEQAAEASRNAVPKYRCGSEPRGAWRFSAARVRVVGLQRSGEAVAARSG